MGNEHTYKRIYIDDKDKKEQKKWVDADEKDANLNLISTFLKSLSELECETFMNDSVKKDLNDAEFTVTIPASRVARVPVATQQERVIGFRLPFLGPACKRRGNKQVYQDHNSEETLSHTYPQKEEIITSDFIFGQNGVLAHRAYS